MCLDDFYILLVYNKLEVVLSYLALNTGFLFCKWKLDGKKAPPGRKNISQEAGLEEEKGQVDL
jgi:hypothetical protein